MIQVRTTGREREAGLGVRGDAELARQSQRAVELLAEELVEPDRPTSML